MSAMAPPPPAPAPPALLTAEEFARRYATRRAELVKGRVVELPMPNMKHGKVCYRVTMALGTFVEPRDLGHVMTNDSWVVTQRGPDTVRGSDILFVSYGRLAKGKVPEGLLDVVPELVFEVRSPSDRWTDMIAKMLEYLSAGVSVVVILDPKTESASVFRPDDRQVIFEAADTLTVPDVLPGFAVPVRALFE
jgi:Uma2 family endonuclease